MLQYLLLLEAGFPLLWCSQKMFTWRQQNACLLLLFVGLFLLASFVPKGHQWWSLAPTLIGYYGGFSKSHKIPHKIGSKRGEIPNFTIHLSLFTCHYSSVTIHWYCSSVTIHDTVHSEFCLFKGGCPLCLGLFSSIVLVLISLPRTSLLRERTHLLPLLLLFYYYLVHLCSLQAL